MPNLNTWLFVRKRQLTLQENPKKKKKEKEKEKEKRNLFYVDLDFGL